MRSEGGGAYVSEAGSSPTLSFGETFYARTHWVGAGAPLLPSVDVTGGERMAVCRIETHFDHLETANVTGVKNELRVMDGTDLNTSAGGGLRHGGGWGDGGGGGRRKQGNINNMRSARKATRLRLPCG